MNTTDVKCEWEYTPTWKKLTLYYICMICVGYALKLKSYGLISRKLRAAVKDIDHI